MPTILQQINIIKKSLINDHISKLHNILNNNCDANTYLKINNDMININGKILTELEKLIDLADIVYEHNLLDFERERSSETGYVDLSEMRGDQNAGTYKNIVYIDEYSEI
jgi:hypothetical protein